MVSGFIVPIQFDIVPSSLRNVSIVARLILEGLTKWFEVEESREGYIKESAEQPFFAAYYNGEPVGFLCLKETGRDTVELAVMGVKK